MRKKIIIFLSFIFFTLSGIGQKRDIYNTTIKNATNFVVNGGIVTIDKADSVNVVFENRNNKISLSGYGTEKDSLGYLTTFKFSPKTKLYTFPFYLLLDMGTPIIQQAKFSDYTDNGRMSKVDALYGHSKDGKVLLTYGLIISWDNILRVKIRTKEKPSVYVQVLGDHEIKTND